MTMNPPVEQDNQVANLELFLLNLRYKEGKLIEAEGNRPILLDDPDSAWVVYSGAVDLFAIPVQNGDGDSDGDGNGDGDGENLGAPEHLIRIMAGQLLLGIAPDTHGSIRLLMRGTTGTRLLVLKKARLWELAQQLEYGDIVAAMCADWVLALAHGIGREMPPKESLQIEAEATYQVGKQHVVLPARGLLWVQFQAGAAQLCGDPALSWASSDLCLPISKHTWIELTEATPLTAISTAQLLQEPTAPICFDHFHRLACAALVLRQDKAVATERIRWLQRLEAEDSIMQQALLRLSSPLSSNGHAVSAQKVRDTHDALYTACRVVCEELGIELTGTPRMGKGQSHAQALKLFARSARIQIRDVALRGQWWRKDNGPLLAFQADTQQPVVLLPQGRGYKLWEPVAGTTTPVTRQQAATLSQYAYMFYRPFPNQELRGWTLLKFGIRGNQRDLLILLGIGGLLGLLGLIPPIATGLIFNTIVPAAEVSSLIQVGIALLIVAIVVGLLQIVRGLTVLRLQSRVDSRLQAAVWDRLLSLPPRFFRNYTAGGLGARAMGVTQISRLLSGRVFNTILTTIFSVFNLALLFYYSAQLALVAIVLVAISLIVTASVAFLFVRYQRIQLEFEGQLSGIVLQLLKGVIKLRVAGAENQAFAQWVEPFTVQRSLAYKGRTITNMLAAYNAAYPLIALLTIFTLVAISPHFISSVGNLVAFNLAFFQFLSSWSLLGSILINVLPIIPTYERLQPILQAQPEVDELKTHPGELSGKIELVHVSFRYNEKTPLVLHDISLEIQPGAFVALVGASGSGKSTLLRLLLGFDTPESGTIYYDDQDLADLDVREVRTQIGVVLQNATLLSGEIFSNIIGSSPSLTLDDAWDAARMAGLEEDIRAMPMGMHTVVSESGSNISGGQRQRLFIARSLVNKPRMLIFDEATSALDNRTQDIVSRSIAELQATRVVIAHRLSTIMKADQIYVFEKGRIVQAGSYQTLVNQPGPFADLAKRQKL